MKFKAGEEVIVQDVFDDGPRNAIVTDIVENGYYVKFLSLETAAFYYDFEIRKLTKLEKALK